MKCLREWKWLYVRRALVIHICVLCQKCLHHVINGSQRACKTDDNIGITQKSENLFYATNPRVLVTIFRHCVSYLWKTKMRNKMKMKCRKKQHRLSKTFEKTSQNTVPISSEVDIFCFISWCNMLWKYCLLLHSYSFFPHF